MNGNTLTLTENFGNTRGHWLKNRLIHKTEK